MPLSPDDLGQFFTDCAGAFNRALEENADVREIADHFTACFIESRAQGTTCGVNDAGFTAALAKGYAYYRSIGTRKMTATGVDSYPICAGHSVATVHWRGEYHTKDRRDVVIDFDVHYLVKDDGGRTRIFGFIAGDEQGLLRQAGVI